MLSAELNLCYEYMYIYIHIYYIILIFIINMYFLILQGWIQSNNKCLTTIFIWVTHSPRITEDVGLVPGTGRYIVAQMTT